jgi:tetratricopeptide (TPR) repeat protein
VSAEHAITQAFGLRSLRWPIDLPVSRARLAELRLAQRRFPEALRMVNLAIESDPRFSIPPYRLRHLRGRIHLALGDRRSALGDFADAIHLAGRWRAVVLPAQSALDGANTVLARTIFDSFVETAAAEAIESGDPRWVRESFQAVELNRAASLRQGIAWSEIWRHRLTPEFWETLARLRAEQARLLSSGQSASALSERLDLKLNELQAKAGLGLVVDKGVNNPETFRSQNSLKQYQSGLSRQEVLLTFHVGEHESFLWAVTREAIALRKIGPRREIGEQVRRFREAVQFGRSEARALGAALYASLFKTVPKQAIDQPEWLLSLDGPLFDLPFGALVTERKVYLAEGHSLQIVRGMCS